MCWVVTASRWGQYGPERYHEADWDCRALETLLYTWRRFEPSSSPSANLPRQHILRGVRGQIAPAIAVISHSNSGLRIGGAGLLFSESPFLSEALDSIHPVRFLKLERLEIPTNFSGTGF